MITKNEFLEKIGNMDKESLEIRLLDIYFLANEFLRHQYYELNMAGEDLMEILESKEKRYYLPEKYRWLAKWYQDK